MTEGPDESAVDRLRPLTDDEVALLTRLAAPPRVDAVKARRVSLKEAVKKAPALLDVDSVDKARPRLQVIGRALAALTGRREVTLLGAGTRAGTFASDDCGDLHAALLKIDLSRKAERELARQRHRLEWLQLASSLDKETLNVGAYPAHQERFLAAAMELMRQWFPWVEVELHVQRRRERLEGLRGLVRQAFDDGEYDYMVAPRQGRAEPGSTPLYSYHFRVVGESAELQNLRSGVGGHIKVQTLVGHRLIVAPAKTSSRERLARMMKDAGVDIEDGSVELIEEQDPTTMRMRAQAGQGLAVISDEYTAVGGSSRDFPKLDRSPVGSEPQVHRVQMDLLRRPGSHAPRHQAFDCVVAELVRQEEKRPRSAAQD